MQAQADYKKDCYVFRIVLFETGFHFECVASCWEREKMAVILYLPPTTTLLISHTGHPPHLDKGREKRID